MVNSLKNVAYIYQPHFKSNCFRSATKDQQGKKYNYVVVTCSPTYNGVWKYDSNKSSSFSVWTNGNTPCYCVPISECEFVKSLKDISNVDTLNKVIAQQKQWYNNYIKNRDYNYVEKPDWVLF